MYKQIFQRLLKNFFITMGREPVTMKEMDKLRKAAREIHIKKLMEESEGIPSITPKTTLEDLMTGPHVDTGPKGPRIWDFSQKKGEVIPFPDKGIRSLIKKGDVTVGKAPKTLPETLKKKKDRGILLRDADEDILRIKRENKEAIERFKEKFGKDEPDKFQYGGIAPLVGEPSYAADFYDDRTPYATGEEVYGPPEKKKKKEKKKEEKDERSPKVDPYKYRDPFWQYGLRFPAEAEAGKTVDPTEGISFDSFGDIDVDMSDPRFQIGKYDPEGDYHPFEFEVGKDSANITLRKRFDEGGIMRAGMAGGGALFKFIEKLFIKASNDIRLGRGKWKGLDQKQRIVQHDNLTKKVVEFQKSGNTEGLEVYFDVNPHEAFAAASKKVKKSPGFIKQGDPITSENFGASQFAPSDESLKARELAKTLPSADERTALKTKYPGISDDLVEKILIDDNPQRKADVMGTIDDYMKLREVGKSEAEAYDIITKSFSKNPTKHAEGGRADFIFGGSAGLRAMWKKMMQGISKRRGEPVPKLFPKLSARDREMEKLVMGTPEQKAFREGEEAHKLEGIDLLINRLKGDKKIIERQAKNKAMGDTGLDFVMKHLEKDMPDVFGPHLKKYTDIDKDILQLENIKKNLIMKDRKLNAYGGRIEMGAGGITKLLKGFLKKKPKSNKLSEQDVAALKKKHGLDPETVKKDEEAFKLRLQQILAKHSTKHAEGGRVSYSGGGRAGLPAITYGTPQMNMQGPQMPAGPQPAGIPGGTIVAQNQMQQAPWMGSQMQQGPSGMPRPQPSGMPRPQPSGMPRPMAAGGGRIGFGLGGFNKARRAFLKMMAGITGGAIAGGTGLLKLGKAAKVAPKVTETIARGADGMPKYITDLIEVVKAKGTKDFIEGVKRSDYSTVHSYKGVEVIEDGAGNVRIKKGKETPLHGSDEPAYHEIEMEIRPGEYVKNKKGKMIKAQDEYVEYTAKPDMDGKMKDIDEYIDEVDHLELEAIAKEDIGWKEGFKPSKQGKASGGLARMLGE